MGAGLILETRPLLFFSQLRALSMSLSCFPAVMLALETFGLYQMLANFFYKGTDSKVFWLCGP